MSLRRSRPARRLSVTPLIDIIFLLLLFFMLSSTFSKFAEVPLSSARTGATLASGDRLFLRLAPDTLSLNGVAMDIARLPAAITERTGTGAPPVIVSSAPAVSAQRLTDLLVTLRSIPGAAVNVLSP
ncbi:biopolymer transporter ExbD [Puniceibacterium sediminis]|uniref:Outer membrane transport energization protein ExbD n=1 Tax=Puniceibacterium sediminis TaxID=1608407 RepID=A0A238YRT4_9RHOB|nr:biopolymer transporter ExbD [Puniceibacterium sediminis]SNR73528.1 outer membrane transport energization protein ExbD [Puniceibacterium sediminis]